MKNCPCCNVEPGELHLSLCSVERCPFCGGQAMSCGCYARQLGYHEDLDCDDEPTDEEWEIWQQKLDMQGRLPWTGEWPGLADCREHNLWCYQDPDHYGNPEMNYGHIPCESCHPKAGPDLNRLYRDFVWDRGLKKFVKPVNSGTQGAE
jgi:hypothetical protein